MQAKGKITIPIGLRKKLKLKKGDLATFQETEEGVLLLPVEVASSQALDMIGQALQEQGLELEELIERGREIRGEVMEVEE